MHHLKRLREVFNFASKFLFSERTSCNTLFYITFFQKIDPAANP